MFAYKSLQPSYRPYSHSSSNPLSRWEKTPKVKACPAGEISSLAESSLPEASPKYLDEHYLATKPFKRWQRRLAAVGVAILIAVGIWAVATNDGSVDLSHLRPQAETSQPSEQAGDQ